MMKTTRDGIFDVVEGILLLFCREMSAEYNAAFARVARLFREAKEAQAATDLDVVDSARTRLDTLAIAFTDRPTESAPRFETGRQIVYQLARLARFACEINTAAYLPLILTSARRMRDDFGIADPTEPTTPEQLRAFEDRWHPTPTSNEVLCPACRGTEEASNGNTCTRCLGAGAFKYAQHQEAQGNPKTAPFVGEFGDARKGVT